MIRGRLLKSPEALEKVRSVCRYAVNTPPAAMKTITGSKTADASASAVRLLYKEIVLLREGVFYKIAIAVASDDHSIAIGIF